MPRLTDPKFIAFMKSHGFYPDTADQRGQLALIHSFVRKYKDPDILMPVNVEYAWAQETGKLVYVTPYICYFQFKRYLPPSQRVKLRGKNKIIVYFPTALAYALSLVAQDKDDPELENKANKILSKLK